MINVDSFFSHHDDDVPNQDADEGEETWMLRREIHQLENKLKTLRDKREVAFRVRY